MYSNQKYNSSFLFFFLFFFYALSSRLESVPFDWWPSVCACPQQFTLITTSHERFIFPEALLSQDPWLPKSRMWRGSYRSLGPIRASSEHLVVITQSVLLRIPAHQSATVPKLTNPSQVTVLSRCVDKNQEDPQSKVIRLRAYNKGEGQRTHTREELWTCAWVKLQNKMENKNSFDS